MAELAECASPPPSFPPPSRPDIRAVALTKSIRDLRRPGHVVAHLITAATAEAVQAAIFDLEARYPRIEARGPYRCDIGWLAAARTFGLHGRS